MLTSRIIERFVSDLHAGLAVPVIAVRLHDHFGVREHEVWLPSSEHADVHLEFQTEGSEVLVQDLFNGSHSLRESLFKPGSAKLPSHSWPVPALLSGRVQLLSLLLGVVVWGLTYRATDFGCVSGLCPSVFSLASAAAKGQRLKITSGSRQRLAALSTWNRHTPSRRSVGRLASLSAEDPNRKAVYGSLYKFLAALLALCSCALFAKSRSVSAWLKRISADDAISFRMVVKVPFHASILPLQPRTFNENCDLRESQVQLGLKRLAQESTLLFT